MPTCALHLFCCHLCRIHGNDGHVVMLLPLAISPTNNILFGRLLCSLVWGPILGLPFPVPMVGAIATMAGVISILSVIHFKLPLAWRQDPDFRRRIRWHHAAQLYIIVMCAQYWTFSVLFYVCPLSIQWVLAIPMTVVREANVLILTAICSRVAANKDDDSLESIVNSLVIFYHQTFLSVCVAVLGTDTTNYACVLFDFLCNMYLLYKYKTLSYICMYVP